MKGYAFPGNASSGFLKDYFSSVSLDQSAPVGKKGRKRKKIFFLNWSLVRERALTIGLCSEEWYSEHSGVCRRAELPGGSVKVKKF